MLAGRTESTSDSLYQTTNSYFVTLTMVSDAMIKNGNMTIYHGDGYKTASVAVRIVIPQKYKRRVFHPK